MNSILENIKGVKILWNSFTATKITADLSGVISHLAAKIGAVVGRPHWLSNKGYLRGGSSGGLIWRLICSIKSSTQYFLSYLKSLASLTGLSAINLSWLRSIKRHNKPLSSSLSSLVAYVQVAFVIVTITACGAGLVDSTGDRDDGVGGGPGVGGSTSSVDTNNNGLIDIYTADQLNDIRNDLTGASLNGISTGCPANGCSGYELRDNIDLANTIWEPIGSCMAANVCPSSFNAIFYGNGFTISNIRIELNTTTNGVGFFGAISTSSNITGVTLQNVDIVLRGSGVIYFDVGGLVGYASTGATIVNNDVVDMTVDRQSSVTIDPPGSLVGDQGNGKSRDSITGPINPVVITVVNLAPIVARVDLNVTGTSDQDAVANVSSAGTYNGKTFTAYAYILETDDLDGNAATVVTNNQIVVTFATDNENMCDFDGGGKTSEHIISAGRPVEQVHLVSAPDLVRIKDTAKCIITVTAVEGGETSSPTTYTGDFPDTPPTLLPVGTNNVINVSAGDLATVTIKVTKTDPGIGMFTNSVSQATGCTIARTSIGGTTPTGVGDTYTIAEFTVNHTAGLLGGSCSFDVTASEDGNSTIPTIPSIRVNFNPRKADTDGNGLIEIYTADELNLIRMDLTGAALDGSSDGCPSGGCNGYELMADIDLAAVGPAVGNWEPLGSCTEFSACDNPFDAIFEGNNYTISNITIELSSSTATYGVGFFAGISATSQLRNVTLDNVNISLTGSGSYTNVGGLVGFADSGARIDNSSVVNTVREGVSAASSVGGLVGYGVGVIISSSYVVVASISATGDNVGGLVGFGQNAIISSSYAVVNSISGANTVGGLVGNGPSVIIASSYAVVNSISGRDNVGGLVGVGNGVGGTTTISSSYAVVNSISGRDNVGGLVGYMHTATVTSSYALTMNLTSTKFNKQQVDGLLGFIGGGSFSFVMVSSSYWLEGVSYTRGVGSAITTRPITTRAPTNSGEPQTADALRMPTAAATGNIYDTWASAQCNSGTPAWDFGTAAEYPALNCLTENISLAKQRETATNALSGMSPLDAL